MSKNSKIKDDCFALPKGINWCPVDTSLETLKNGELVKIRKRNMAKRVYESRQIVIDSINRIALPKLGDLYGRF